MALCISHSVEMVSFVFSLLVAGFITQIGEMTNEYEVFLSKTSEQTASKTLTG
jgi:hypothetical protein